MADLLERAVLFSDFALLFGGEVFADDLLTMRLVFFMIIMAQKVSVVVFEAITTRIKTYLLLLLLGLGWGGRLVILGLLPQSKIRMT